MPHASFTFVDLLGWAVAQPWFALVLGAAGALVITFTRPGQHRLLPNGSGRMAAARYANEARVIGWAALAVVTAVITEHSLRTYVVDLNNVVPWWRFATPVFAAGLGAAALLALILSRGSERSEQPVLGTTHRTWRSFTSGPAVIGSVSALVALTATTIIAGVLSSTDKEGRHVYLEIPIPNEPGVDPIRVWFFGWAFGLPVLITTAMLTAFTFMALHANAVRPFIRPETVAVEQIERRRIAAGTARLATATLMLALADAWQFIAATGTTTRLTITGAEAATSYDVVWRGAEVATALGWFAPVLEIAAFMMLCLTMRYLSSIPVPSSTPDEAAAVAA